MDPSPDPASRVQALFADFLARKEAGERADFEAICREHATVADALRQLCDERGAVDRLVGEVTGSFAALLK